MGNKLNECNRICLATVSLGNAEKLTVFFFKVKPFYCWDLILNLYKLNDDSGGIK